MFGVEFTLNLLMDVILDVKPSTVGLGAHHYVQLAESDVLDQVDPENLDSVKLLFPAGSAVPSSCKELLRKKFRNLVDVLQGYGQTESGLASCGYGTEHLGMVLPGCKIKIEDPDTGILSKIKFLKSFIDQNSNWTFQVICFFQNKTF